MPPKDQLYNYTRYYKIQDGQKVKGKESPLPGPEDGEFSEGKVRLSVYQMTPLFHNQFFSNFKSSSHVSKLRNKNKGIKTVSVPKITQPQFYLYGIIYWSKRKVECCLCFVPVYKTNR